jgi:predicted nucleic acid-binding protein
LVEHGVADASPLIFLARTRRLDLLKVAANPVAVPAQVIDEVARHHSGQATVAAIFANEWIRPAGQVAIPSDVLSCRLGPGESSVLAWASSHAGSVAMVDDQKARSCAESLAVPTIGVLGLILLAKRKGWIPEARAIVDEMVAAGLDLSPALISDALARVGER